MATAFGSSIIGVPLNYKFEFSLPDIYSFDVGEVVLYSVTHKGECWQLEVCRKAVPIVPYVSYGSGSQFEGRLHLVKTCGSGDASRIARICSLDGGDKLLNSPPMAYFSSSGDKSAWVKLNTVGGQKCKLVVEVLLSMTTLKVSQPQIEFPKSQMSDELLKWFQSEDFGDVTIIAADGQKFRCQREFLVRRSEVFAGMFSSGMKEERENLINMDGYEGDIVAQLLVFVYTDDSQIGRLAIRLYTAAHQYQLDRLKFLCESAMAANLSAETVVKTFRLANFYHLDKLLAVCVDYWNSHKADLAIGDLFADSLEIQEGDKGEQM